MSDSAPPLPVLTYLQRQLAGTLRDGERTHMRYPTPISELLQFQIVEVGEASAVIALQARAAE